LRIILQAADHFSAHAPTDEHDIALKINLLEVRQKMFKNTS